MSWQRRSTSDARSPDRRDSDRDRGESNVLGLVLIAPVALAGALLITWIGRLTDTEATVQSASRAAAQAAARQRHPVAAQWAATATANEMLLDVEQCSTGPTVVVDISQWSQDRVTVSVSCTPARNDVAIIGAKRQTLTASATATLDPYRAEYLP